MPHKHKRDKSKADGSSYDLPPSRAAYALPVKKAMTDSQRKRPNLNDDTPRAFTRLLHPYRPPRSGLDDGPRPSKKRKTSKTTTTTTTSNQPPPPRPAFPAPTILPHESFSAFNARVDAALPLSGLSRKSAGGKGLEKGKQTKTERKMQRMQREWREEDKRRREKREEEALENVDGEDVEDYSTVTGKTKKGKKRRNGGGGNGAVDDDKEDPWAHIKAKRIDTAASAGGGGLVGLHDVVLAPPKFSRVPKGKENFGVGKGLGKGIIGLKRKGELSEARRSVVDGYRELMRGKAGGSIQHS
ncbi:hypothetical protein N7G274_009787 [Stereocaulon virgatum]|uniref:Uncharacterized protein n=1 Tax=Stereocaulon virgatum TaxID=373712 RepID=A0ABR3ZXS7_9LECA